MHKRFVLVEINDNILKAKQNNKCLKSVFGVARAEISATILRGMESNNF